MNTTTQAEAIELIRSTIQAITPSGDYADAPWREAGDDVAVADLRSFALLATPATFQRDPERGLFGCGERYTFDLAVVTGYGSLDDRSAARVLARDGLDLRRALEYLVGTDPAGGFVCVEYEGFEAETGPVEGKARTGRHKFVIDYMEDTA